MFLHTYTRRETLALTECTHPRMYLYMYTCIHNTFAHHVPSSATTSLSGNRCTSCWCSSSKTRPANTKSSSRRCTSGGGVGVSKKGKAAAPFARATGASARASATVTEAVEAAASAASPRTASGFLRRLPPTA